MKFKKQDTQRFTKHMVLTSSGGGLGLLSFAERKKIHS